MGKKIVITPGDVYNRLTILGEVETHCTPCGTRKRRVKCLCECGTIGVHNIVDLRSGNSKSCGCYNVDMLKLANTTHGLYQTKVHRTWHAMINRCTNPKQDNYHRYGGVGITVCDRWLKSFVDFHSDMGDPPQDGKRYTIDRIDTNGNYEPDNCRWATDEMQQKNKKTNRKVIYNGELVKLKDIYEEYIANNTPCVTYRNFYQRINHYKWSVEDALATPQ